MPVENLKSFAIAIVAALGFLLATVPGHAQNTFQCTGNISDGSTINGSLVVPANAGCSLENVTVVGNVLVGMGAFLYVQPSIGQKVAIYGNIVADQCNFVILGPLANGAVTSVEGNVNIQNCTSSSGYSGVFPQSDLTISGNFVCANNSDACVADLGVVEGNLKMDNNLAKSGSNDVTNNMVSGNVDFSGNSGTNNLVNSVGRNTIGGNLLCSNNSH
jgi:hypothetical protein